MKLVFESYSTSPNINSSTTVTCNYSFSTFVTVPGGGYSTKFYTGRLRPEVQTLTLLHTILERRGTPSYTFRRILYPFHIPREKVLLNFSLEKALKMLR